MDYQVDKRLFADIACIHPDEIIRPGVEYDSVNSCYKMFAWGITYLIYPEKNKIQSHPKQEGDDYFCIFLLNYLLMEQKQNQ